MTTRTTLRRDLSDLKQKVYELGEKCIEISDLYISILEHPSELTENKINEIYLEIKNECKNLHDKCFLVLTLQQPLIKDLRFVIGTLQIVLNIEKIVELYISILSVSIDISELDIKNKNQFIEMSKKISELIKNSIKFYLSSNITFSEKVNSLISEVNINHDLLYKKTLNEIASESGQKAQIEAQILFSIRTLSKISDLTINIIEQIKFIILGNQE